MQNIGLNPGSNSVCGGELALSFALIFSPSMNLSSIMDADFFLCLDVCKYFEAAPH